MRFHASIPELLGSPTKFQIIKFLLSHEAVMSEREIASVLKTSHMNVNRTLRELADVNLVNYSVVGKAHLWKVNRKSFAYRVLSKLINDIGPLFDPLAELKRMIVRHLPLKIIEKMILFGSVAQGKETSDSDIDLFILVKNLAHQERVEQAMGKLTTDCLDVFGNRLSAYILTEQQYGQKKGLALLAQIERGIQLYPNGSRHDA